MAGPDSSDPTVYVVHCVDTEGPNYEPLEETIDKVNNIFGYDFEASEETLRRLQNKEIDLDGEEEAVYKVVEPWRLDLNDSWDKVESMLDEITADSFRQSYPDSAGNGWRYSWFCLDHVGITGENPQHRSVGHHCVFDRYRRYLARNDVTQDLIEWHFHPPSLRRDSPRAGTTYVNSPVLYETLARKVIDRQWFPAAYRPGYHTERPDSHWFLEQWIPFDYANQSGASAEDQPDLAAGRFGDWRRAPETWIPYQPSHHDYQRPGECNRYIARCLYTKNRLRQIKIDHVREAFREAADHGAALLSVTSHDWRDMGTGINRVWEMLSQVDDEFDEVRFEYVDAVEGMRRVLDFLDTEPPGFNVWFEQRAEDTVLRVTADGDVFGPQPYLAIKTKSDRYHWENFDFQGEDGWSYTFDFNTLEIDAVRTIGVAANTPTGASEVVTIDPETGESERHTRHTE